MGAMASLECPCSSSNAKKDSLAKTGSLGLPPAYSFTKDDPSISTTSTPANSYLPSAFNFYSPCGFTSVAFRLGEHKNQPLYAITLPKNLHNELILHTGPDSHSPVLAKTTYDGKLGQHHMITLPVHRGPGSEDCVQEQLRYTGNLKSARYSFQAPVGQDKHARLEKFEWRRSHGDEVHNLANATKWGWKLVRLDHEPAEGHSNGSETSDGKEVVAIYADVSKLSMSKVGEFQFLGGEANGELGEVWSLMAVITLAAIWCRDCKMY
ncbi:hypothetical protein MMC20_003522 [Loxospora ochrophaea]|nr:hypothetical protein [Loxospora ochrophaea]